jgi:Ni/Co efflux regulator RcnB
MRKIIVVAIILMAVLGMTGIVGAVKGMNKNDDKDTNPTDGNAGRGNDNKENKDKKDKEQCTVIIEHPAVYGEWIETTYKDALPWIPTTYKNGDWIPTTYRDVEMKGKNHDDRKVEEPYTGKGQYHIDSVVDIEGHYEQIVDVPGHWTQVVDIEGHYNLISEAYTTTEDIQCDSDDSDEEEHDDKLPKNCKNDEVRDEDGKCVKEEKTPKNPKECKNGKVRNDEGKCVKTEEPPVDPTICDEGYILEGEICVQVIPDVEEPSVAIDTDNDGIPDVTDNCPKDPKNKCNKPKQIFSGYTFGTSDCNRMSILAGQLPAPHADYLMGVIAWDYKYTVSEMIQYCTNQGVDMTTIPTEYYTWDPS